MNGSSTNLTRTVLDFGNLVNAIEVRSGASVTFEDLLVTGLPWTVIGTNLTEGLPFVEDSVVFPSVVTYPNSSVMPRSQ